MNSAAVKQVKDKGFRKAWWQANRASSCKGSGVGKALDALEKLGVAANGLPTGVKNENAAQAMYAYDMLSNALLKAKAKCGMLQDETSSAIDEYKKVIKIAYPKVQSQARAFNGLCADANKGIKDIDKAVAALTKQISEIAKLSQKGLDGMASIYNNYQPGTDGSKIHKYAKELAKNTGITTAEKTLTEISNKLAQLKAKLADFPPTPDAKKLSPPIYQSISRATEAASRAKMIPQQALAAFNRLLKEIPAVAAA